MKKRIIGCIVLLLIIGLFSYLSLCGINLGKVSLPEKLGLYTDGEGIRRGLDLDGGSSITFAPVLDEEYEGDVSQDLDNVIGVMRSRLTNLGYTEANVYKLGDAQIAVEIPGISNAQEAIDILGQTAKLQFVDSSGNVVLEGSDISDATAAINNGDYIVSLTLTSEAVDKFSAATAEMAKLSSSGKNYISIQLDGVEIAAPYVKEQITNTTCEISHLTLEESRSYAAIISAGKLPFALDAVEYRSIGPTLGEGALENSILAAAVGLAIIILLMLIFYRLPGAVSVIALLFYVGLVGLILSVFQINLSLPGIAGIILSIGMAVDANVVIFERIKEELRLGKSTRAAVKAGFDKAIIAVIDANVTTVIAAVVILIFGKGTVQGFAVTLLIGVIVSMITAVFVTKYLLNCCVSFGWTDAKLYCSLNVKKRAPIAVSSAKKGILIATACIVFVGIGLSVFSAAVPNSGFGINWGIDFTGGSVLNVSLLRDVTSSDLADVKTLVSEITEDKNVSVSVVTVPEADTEVLKSTDIIVIKTVKSGNEIQKALVSSISEKYSLPYSATEEGEEGDKVDTSKIEWLLSSDSVGPMAASDLTKSAILSTVIASLLMLLYITVRFDFFSGVSAVIALLHDLSMMVIAIVLFRVQANITFIAAILTILGYSINATIIIFDRVRENKKLNGDKAEFGAIVDLSILQTFRRSLFTTITTLATIGALYVLGVPSIKEFAFPIIVGLICGFFSSVFISGSAWTAFNILHKKHKAAKAED